MSRLAFQFHHCLGVGGYGEVYLARQHTEGGLHREVAVKVLYEKYDDDSNAVKRLRDEGQALALLAHPAILTVHGFAKVDGRLALVTEYIEGSDVSVFCDPDDLLPSRIAVAIVREVAEALDYALTVPNPHTGRKLKMIHRDVKPANIRVSTDGTVKLLDFGVARSNEMERQAKTAMGDVLLTSGFAAPESLGFGVTSPSVDVFALGVTLFAMLTGKEFYRGRDLKFQVTLALNAVDFAAYLEERLQMVEPGPIRDLLTDMLGFQHELRPKAREVAERLDAIVDALPGPTLGQWARNRQWPEQRVDDGELEGLLFDAEGVRMAAKPQAEPPPPPPPVDLGSTSSIVPARGRAAGPSGPSQPSPPKAPESKAPGAKPKAAPPMPERSGRTRWVVAGALVLVVGVVGVAVLGVGGLALALVMLGLG